MIRPLGIVLALTLAACSREAPPAPATADPIPVAHTPPGGYGRTFPPPVLARCTEPLAAGAPDLRGLWKTVRAERNGEPVPADAYVWTHVERIEQCGNRIVDTGGGTIADARADGTIENGVHDVSAFDYTTPIRAVASYEDGAFVLRPLLVPSIPLVIPWIRVTRRLDAEGRLIWTRPDQGHLVVTLERIGSATDPHTLATDRRPEGGPPPGTSVWRYRLRMLWAFLTAPD